MDFQKALEQLQALEKEIQHEIEEQSKQIAEQQGRAPYYRFVYEQLMDTGEWCPNDQLIQAYDIGRAFATLGYVIRELKLTVRDIRYGLASEIEEEMKLVHSYWTEQLKKHDQI